MGLRGIVAAATGGLLLSGLIALVAIATAQAHPADRLTNREAKREAGWFIRTNVRGVVPGSGEFTILRRPAHNRAHVLVIFARRNRPCAWEATVGVRETETSWRFRWLERPNIWECV